MSGKDEQAASPASAGTEEEAAVTAPSAAKKLVPERVVVHPIVLLSVVDHYNRVAAGTKRRVVGVLLGSVSKGVVDVTNSYAVPFDEDKGVWFLDHNYHEDMFRMFRKVTANERVVGWYSTGPNVREHDININELFRKYTRHPAFVIIDPQPTSLGLPTKAYISIDEVQEDGTNEPTFKHIPTEIGAVEAEEVGVEHLLRDVHDMSVSSLAQEVNQKMLSLRSLHMKLKVVHTYLSDLCEGRLPVNQAVIFQLQEVFNLLPNLNVAELIKAFAVKSNDAMVVIYLSSLIRSIIALHDLINNRLANSEKERKSESTTTDGKSVTGDDANDGKQDARKGDKDAKKADSTASGSKKDA